MLNSKAALITGSLDGIGFAIAARLARDGSSVMLSGFGDAALIDERVKALSALGVQADYHGADLSIPAQIEDMVAATERRFGAVDIVVNNAVTRHYAHIEELPVEKWNYALAVNLSAP
jgi:3-hydroxybutyrate dehydrogenase